MWISVPLPREHFQINEQKSISSINCTSLWNCFFSLLVRSIVRSVYLLAFLFFNLILLKCNYWYFCKWFFLLIARVAIVFSTFVFFLPSNKFLMIVVITKTLHIIIVVFFRIMNKNVYNNVYHAHMGCDVGDLVLNFKANHISLRWSAYRFFLWLPFQMEWRFISYQVSGNYFKLNLLFDQVSRWCWSERISSDICTKLQCIYTHALTQCTVYAQLAHFSFENSLWR